MVSGGSSSVAVRRIGLDIGGTSTKVALIDSHDEVLVSRSSPTRPGAAGVIATAIDAVIAIAAAGEVSVDDVELIGVGIPGAVDPSSGTVRHAVNVGIGAEPALLGAALADRFGTAVHVENDVKAAALGAHVLTAGSRSGPVDLAYLSVGTGIAAGFVENGRIRRGASLVAGEIGHIPIDPAGPLCACGQRGCIEAIASGSAIERDWPTSDGSPARALEAAAQFIPQAAQIWHAVVGGLSRAVQLLALTFDPDVIVLSGGVADLGDRLRTAIIERLHEDQRHSQFLSSLDLAARFEIIDPSVLLGPIGAVRAAATAITVAG